MEDDGEFHYGLEGLILACSCWLVKAGYTACCLDIVIIGLMGKGGEISVIRCVVLVLA